MSHPDRDISGDDDISSPLWTETSPETVFTRLNLDKAGNNLPKSSLFTLFAKYTDASHAKNSTKPMTTGWIVRAQYDGLDVVKMIMSGEKASSSAAATKRMEAIVEELDGCPPAPPITVSKR